MTPEQHLLRWQELHGVEASRLVRVWLRLVLWLSRPLRVDSQVLEVKGETGTEKPYAITSCDAGGCWANDGSRLNRLGPNLWGPRGICTVQGSLLQCP